MKKTRVRKLARACVRADHTSVLRADTCPCRDEEDLSKDSGQDSVGQKSLHPCRPHKRIASRDTPFGLCYLLKEMADQHNALLSDDMESQLPAAEPSEPGLWRRMYDEMM